MQGSNSRIPRGVSNVVRLVVSGDPSGGVLQRDALPAPRRHETNPMLALELTAQATNPPQAAGLPSGRMGIARNVMRPLVVQRYRENMTKMQLLLDMLALSPEEANEPPRGRITVNIEWEQPLGDPARQRGLGLGSDLNNPTQN